MPFEFIDRRVQPDRLAEIKLVADRVKRVKYLVSAGVVSLVADDGIPHHSVVLEFLSPETEHGESVLSFNQMSCEKRKKDVRVY